MIVFFDSDTDQIRIIKECVDKVHVCRTFATLVKKLEDECDLLFLNLDVGIEIVNWIEDNNPFIRKIIIHSDDHIMAQKCRIKLKELKYITWWIPFDELIERIQRGKLNE